MHAIGRYIRDQSASLDVVLLQELWMRPDHDVIQSYLDQVGPVTRAANKTSMMFSQSRRRPLLGHLD